MIRYLSLLLLMNHCLPLRAKSACDDADATIHASRFDGKSERKAAFERRTAAACLRIMNTKEHDPAHGNNGDDKKIKHYAAECTKGFEHDSQSGLLTPKGKKSYKTLLKAINSGKQEDYNAVELATGSTRKLVNPQASATFSFEGADSSSFAMEPFPTLSSKEAAALLIENYLLALTRDVHFDDYGTGSGTDKDSAGDSITKHAAAILNDLGKAFKGPRTAKNKVKTSVLFRGNDHGSLVGPYISQFLFIDTSGLPKAIFPPAVGLKNIDSNLFVQFDQQRPIARPGKNFGITFDDFIALQNNAIPEPYQPSDYSGRRYIIDGRDLASFVHFDFPYEPYYNALNILFAYNFPLSPASPYINGSILNEAGFVTLGFFDAFAVLGGVASEAAKACWMQKWRVQRALRPEAFAGLVHSAKTTKANPYCLDASLFEKHAGIDLLEWVHAQNAKEGAATYLLSQAYPEGSPLHPSWPSGHATIAGACITVIKALFNDQALISAVLPPVKPDPSDPTKLVQLKNEDEKLLTIGGELDKLASNVSIGRNFAGIHYRADADQGMALGEAVAIKYLQDRAACLTEQSFKGFELTKIDGTRILITATEVKRLLLN